MAAKKEPFSYHQCLLVAGSRRTTGRTIVQCLREPIFRGCVCVQGMPVASNRCFLNWVPRLFAVALMSMARGGTPPSALDAFKTLQGTWSIQAEGKLLNIQMTYQS